MNNSAPSHELSELRQKFNHAVRLRKSGRVAAAIALLRALARKHPESASVLGYLAGIHYQTGRPERAAPLFRTVTELSPASELAARGLAHSLLDLGDADEAVKELKRFLSVRKSPDLEAMLSDLTARPNARLKPPGRALAGSLRSG